MASLTNYPGTITQTTGGSYRTFSNLNNIKTNADNVWATSSGNIKGKSSSPNRPSTITCTNFGFNLPEGAEPTKIITTYRHKKTGSLNIPAPTLTLLGTGDNTFSVKGSAPTTSMVTHQYNCTTAKITRAMVNSSDFGVKINYPANTNSSEGTLSISYVRVTVEYKVPSYSLTLKKVSGGYNEESYTVECSISNKNLTSYNPSCTLTAPTGFSFTDFNGSGEYTMVSPTTISWNPKFSSKVASSTASFKFDVDVTYPSGQTSYTGTFTLSESLYSTSKSLSATITDRPSGEGSEEDDSNTPIITDDDTIPVPVKWDKATVNEEISFNVTSLTWLVMFGFPVNDEGEVQYPQQNSPIQPKWDNGVWSSTITNYYDGDYCGIIVEGTLVALRTSVAQRYVVFVYPFGETCNWNEYKDSVPSISYWFEAVPLESDLSTPNFSVLEITGEELDRLGDGYTYIAQSHIKHTTTDTFSRDWYKNNRIGVFNNALFSDDGTTASHYDHWYINSYGTATVQSDGTKLLNTSGDTNFVMRSIIPSNKTIISANAYSYNPPYIVEFDIVETNGTSNSDAQVQIYSSESAGNFSQAVTTGHYKIEVTSQEQKIWVDDTLINTTNLSLPNARISFRVRNGKYLIYKNFKVVSSNHTFQEVFNTAKYWSKATGGLNTYENCEVEFVYDEDYPLYVLMTGDYPEAEDYGYDMGTIKHTEPCIIEEDVYNSSEPNGTYPTPITALLDGGDISTLELSPNQTSQSVVLYDFPVDETVSTNDTLAIRGFQVRAGLDYTDDLAIQAKLHSPTGEVGNRSILIDSQDEEIVIGGLGDLWGFTTLQMQHLGLWELELGVANILNNSDATIIFNNIEIIFYLETVEKQEITIKVEDEDIAYYGAFIETVKIPEGLNTDTSFLSIDGTDTNDAYRQNIREKTITIEFNLSNCELQTSTDMLRQLTKLFVNEKDQYNRPIPKRIQFSHYPNDYFEYIMEEPFDVDTEITDYNIKASLTVPSGTSYSLYDTITNTTGNANGLAAINPIITIRPSDTNIQITENNTDQTFNLTYTGDWYDHTVEIDCEDRKVYIVVDEDTRIDISKYVDYNSDWFRLDGEYDFSSVNCTILSVIFTERW